jgi:Fur family transcriptional regulator, zinc uptake regulator
MAHDNIDLSTLTKNELLVFEALKESDGPMKAYDVLDVLKSHGVRAPMTVYRALEGLEEKGIVHKLDALNAFVLCSHDHPHQVQSFLVCSECGMVQEISPELREAPQVEDKILGVVRATGFQMREARLEIKGVCQNCTDQQNAHSTAAE